jgi:hypothetical protein
MQRWELELLGVRTPSQSRILHSGGSPTPGVGGGSVLSPSGTATPMDDDLAPTFLGHTATPHRAAAGALLDGDLALPRSTHHLHHLEGKALAAEQLRLFEERHGHHATTVVTRRSGTVQASHGYRQADVLSSPSALLHRMSRGSARDDGGESEMRSPPLRLPGAPPSTSELSLCGSQQSHPIAPTLSASKVLSSPGGSFRRAAESVRLAMQSPPGAAAPSSHLGTSVAVSPAALATASPFGATRASAGANRSATPGAAARAGGQVPPVGIEAIGSPFSRHAQGVRRQRAERLPDVFVRAAEQRAWVEQEGAPATAAEAAAREAAAVEVRKVQNRNADFLHSLEEAAARETSFLFKGEAARRAAAERALLETGRSDLLDSRNYGVANKILATHKAAEVDSLVLDSMQRALDEDQSKLWRSPRAAARTVTAAGTTREGAEPPPLFSFDLSEEEKHWLMCALKYTVSTDCIANDAEFRSRLGWYRGDVAAQFRKLGMTFSDWTCLCYTRGVTWNMLHNCLVQVRRPIAWSQKAVSRAAYFGRVSVAQLASLHDRLLNDYATQYDEWLAAGAHAAAAALA